MADEETVGNEAFIDFWTEYNEGLPEDSSAHAYNVSIFTEDGFSNNAFNSNNTAHAEFQASYIHAAQHSIFY